jgi:hypothetical protein
MGNTRNKHGPGYIHACQMNGNLGTPRSDVITLNRGPTIVLLLHGKPGNHTGNGKGISCPVGIYILSIPIYLRELLC